MKRLGWFLILCAFVLFGLLVITPVSPENKIAQVYLSIVIVVTALAGAILSTAGDK